MFDHEWNENSLKNYVLDSIDIFGVDRCMFGSNFPVDKLPKNGNTKYKDLILTYKKIVDKKFNEKQVAQLFCENARKFYKI